MTSIEVLEWSFKFDTAIGCVNLRPNEVVLNTESTSIETKAFLKKIEWAILIETNLQYSRMDSAYPN